MAEIPVVVQWIIGGGVAALVVYAFIFLVKFARRPQELAKPDNKGAIARQLDQLGKKRPAN